MSNEPSAKADTWMSGKDRNDLKAIADALGGHFGEEPAAAAMGGDAKERCVGWSVKTKGDARESRERPT